MSQFGPFSMSDVKQAFAAFDLDKNAFVGAAELRSVYSALGEEVTDDEIDEMIRMVDTDGDGQVSEAEFAKMIFRYAPQVPDKPKHLPPTTMGAVAAPTGGAATATGTANAGGASTATGAGALTATTSAPATGGAGGAPAIGGSGGEERKSGRKKNKHKTGLASGTPTPRGKGAADKPSPEKDKANTTNTDDKQPAAAASGGGGGSAATTPANATAATSSFAFSAAKVAEKKGDLLSVMTSLSINPEQIKRLMAQFQQIGKVDDSTNNTTADGKTPAAGASAVGADTRRAKYRLNFNQFCKLLALDPASDSGDSSASASSTGAGATGGSAKAGATAYANRLFGLFDHDGSRQIDAKEFLIGISAYADSTKDDKLKFAFSLYDEDNSGKISMNELIKILRAVHMASSDKQVQKKADTIMAHGDKDKDGVLSFDEFVQCARSFPSLLFPVMNVTKKMDGAIF